MLTDVEAGADIYGFAQDQIARLVAAGALQTWSGTGYDEWITANNDAGAAGAATVLAEHSHYSCFGRPRGATDRLRSKHPDPY